MKKKSPKETQRDHTEAASVDRTKAQSSARRIVMGESTGAPDRFKRGEKVEP